MFFACAFLLMPQAILGQRTYAGVDLMETKSPYREALTRPPYVKSLIQTDQAEALAGRVSFFKALRSGTFQRWDPNLAAGQPSGTLPINAFFSPFSVGFLFLPAWYAIGLKVFLALLFCQTFTYLLVRRLGAAVGPAVLAGVAYTFSGVNLVFIHRVDAVFLVPALFWAVHRLVTGKADVRGAAVLAGFVAWAWAEGFPSGWVFCVYATTAWAAWLAVRAGGRPRDMVRRLLWPAAGVVWGVALSAITLVPFISEVLDRGTLDVRVGPGGGHIPDIQIFGLLDLSATGPPLSGPWWSGFNPVESVSHVGMIAAVALAAGLLAAAFGRIRFSREGADAWLFFCGMVVAGVVVNFVGTPLLSVVERLPGIARNPIGRSRFLISLAVAVLGALALDAWWARRQAASNTPLRAASGVACAILAGAFLLPAADFFRTASAFNLLRHVTSHFALALLLATAAVLIAYNAFLRRSPRAYTGATVALAALLFAQLGWPLRHFTPEAPIGDFYGERAGHRALRELLDDRYRFAATGYNYYPNSGQALGLPDLRGLALHAKEFKAVVGAFNPQAFARDALKINLRREEWNLTSPLLDHLAVRFFAEGADELPFGRVADGADLAWDRWASAKGLPAEMTSGMAPGPLNGIYLPLRATSKGCRGAFVTLRILSGEREVAATTRPAFDLGGWAGFAVLARNLQAGDPYRFTATPNRPSCQVDVGLDRPPSRPPAPDRGPGPGRPPRLNRAVLDLRAALGVAPGERPRPLACVPRPGVAADVGGDPAAGRRRRGALRRRAPNRRRRGLRSGPLLADRGQLGAGPGDRRGGVAPGRLPEPGRRVEGEDRRRAGSHRARRRGADRRVRAARRPHRHPRVPAPHLRGRRRRDRGGPGRRRRRRRQAPGPEEATR